MKSPRDSECITGAYRPLRIDGWRGRVRADWAELAEGDPLAWLRGWPCTSVNNRPASRVWRVDPPGAVLYAKHITGRKQATAGRRHWIEQARWLGPASLAAHVLRIHRQLRAAGFCAPPVVLAARRRSGWGAEELFVTEARSGRKLKWALADMPEADRRVAVLRTVGRRIAAFHLAGFIHGDLLPNNLLLKPDGTDVVWLDNDRTRHWPVPPPAYLRMRNLRQVTFRLRPHLPWREVRQLLAAYFDARGVRSAAARRATRHVIGRIRHRRDRSAGAR